MESNTGVNKDLNQSQARPEKAILVTEDNDVNFMVFEAFLSDWGFEVVRANNGNEAVDWVKSKKFEAILMDLYMPEMDGMTAIKKIRENGYMMPIIVLTASSVEKDLKEALANGASDFLLKPVTGTSLKEKLNRLLV